MTVHNPLDRRRDTAALELAVASLERAHAEHRALAAQAAVHIAETRSELGELKAMVKPVTEAWGSLQSGIRTIGAIGRVGRWCFRFAFLGVASWAFVNAIAHGSSIADAVEHFFKALAAGEKL